MLDTLFSNQISTVALTRRVSVCRCLYGVLLVEYVCRVTKAILSHNAVILHLARRRTPWLSSNLNLPKANYSQLASRAVLALLCMVEEDFSPESRWHGIPETVWFILTSHTTCTESSLLTAY